MHVLLAPSPQLITSSIRTTCYPICNILVVALPHDKKVPTGGCTCMVSEKMAANKARYGVHFLLVSGLAIPLKARRISSCAWRSVRGLLLPHKRDRQVPIRSPAHAFISGYEHACV